MPAIHDALPNTAIGALRVSPGYDRAFPLIETRATDRGDNMQHFTEQALRLFEAVLQDVSSTD